MDISEGSSTYLSDSILKIRAGWDNVSETLIVSHVQSRVSLSKYLAYANHPSSLFHSLCENLTEASINGHFLSTLRNRLMINFHLPVLPDIAAYGNITCMNFRITYMPDNTLRPVSFPTLSPWQATGKFTSDYWIFVAEVVAITVGVVVAIILMAVLVYCCVLLGYRKKQDSWESGKLNRARLFENLSDYHMNRSISRARSSSFSKTDLREGELQRQLELYGMVSVSTDSAVDDRTRVIYDETNAMLQLDRMMASPFNSTKTNSNTDENIPVYVKVKLPVRAVETSTPQVDTLYWDGEHGEVSRKLPQLMRPAASDIVSSNGHRGEGSGGEVSERLPHLRPSD